jgi:murein DD-endopeptidase MepM/ murein hydrolase activator NlpD
MRLRRVYTFLYLPDDQSRTREMRVTRLGLLGMSLFARALLVGSGLYLAGLIAGTVEQRNVAEVRAENARLTGQIAMLEERIALLQSDLAAVARQHEQLAQAAGLQPLGETVWEAGIGGRAPLMPLPDAKTVGAAPRLAVMESNLDKLLRQARLQNESCQAMLDTLAGRAAARALLPSIRPIASALVNSGFGKRPDPFTGQLTFHAGLDFAAPIGTPVVATADGSVAVAGFETGFGNIVSLRHGERIVTRYAHLSRSLVQRGERVKRGQVIGYSGKTGRATAPHLHYEVHLGGRPVNPLPYILETASRR